MSNLGDGIRFAALPLLAESLTDDPVRVSGLFVALTLPAVLFGLQAGALVDRWNRRLVLANVNLAQAVVVAVLAVAVAAGVADLWLLYIVAFLVGTAETFVDNAAVTILPDLVPRDRFETANGRLQAAHVAANDFGGALLGAALFAIAAPAAFVGDVALTVCAALIALRLRGVRSVRQASRTTLRRDVVAGLRFVMHQPALRILFGLIVVVAGADMAWFGVLVLYARDELGLTEIGFGALLAAGAAGAITGGLVTDRLTRTLRLHVTGALALGMQSGSLVLLALTGAPALAYVGLVMNGAGFGSFNVVSMSLRQRVAPTEMLGRVNGTFRFLAFGATGAGAAAGGLLARAVGLRGPFVAAAILLAASSVVAFALLGRAAQPRGTTAHP